MKTDLCILEFTPDGREWTFFVPASEFPDLRRFTPLIDAVRALRDTAVERPNT